MRINIHAGHNPDGKVGCGAYGLMGESTMNRQVVDALLKYLSAAGVKVTNCTVDDGTSARNVLEKIVRKDNDNPADLTISIHHNASTSKDYEGDGKKRGTMAYVYRMDGPARPVAEKILQRIADRFGYPNLGIAEKKDLYVLHHTNAPAMLVECCFCDDKDDVDCWNPELMAKAICEGITGTLLDAGSVPVKSSCKYKVQIGAFENYQNAVALRDEVKNAGYDAFIYEER